MIRRNLLLPLCLLLPCLGCTHSNRESDKSHADTTLVGKVVGEMADEVTDEEAVNNDIEDAVDKATEEVVDNAIVEDPAAYPGGEAALLSFVEKNLVYPAAAKRNDIQGTVVLRFMIKKDGSVGDVEVVKSLSKECDQAAVDVVKKLKRFVPARQQGRPVCVWFRFPIRFRQ